MAKKVSILSPEAIQLESGRKRCAVCGEPVAKGTGLYRLGRLVHRDCLGIMKMNPWSYRKSIR